MVGAVDRVGLRLGLGLGLGLWLQLGLGLGQIWLGIPFANQNKMLENM